MLIAQAMRQFLLFTGSEYPLSLVQELANGLD
jgi:shikimate 5-dehydrogenase